MASKCSSSPRPSGVSCCYQRRWMVERSFDWAARFRRLAFACLRSPRVRIVVASIKS
ncbi:transposase [Zoogloea oleivorans]|uniref:transposase n=1 Tax=Zoogloea oleivorans TaxID=1552750 RepID=UPI00319DBC92